MKRLFLVLLSCVMAFALVIAVSANGSAGGSKKEFFVDMTSHREDDKNTSEEDKKDGDGTSNEAGIETGDDSPDEEDDKNIDSNTDVENAGIDDAHNSQVNNPDVDNKSDSSKLSIPEIINVRIDLDSSGVYGSLFLVNKVNTLTNDFIPQQLVRISSTSSSPEIPAGKAGIMLRDDALTALNSMYASAVASGIKDMVLSSGYRNFNEQNGLFNRKVNSYIRKFGRKAAEDRASMVVASPGRSEHQTGFAVDITTRQMMRRSDPLVAEFADTACGKWMAEHVWEFGYIVRYQYNKMNVTGIVYEPWHFRYAGKPHAEIMKKCGFCLEEYIRFLKNKSYITYKDLSGDEYEIMYICPPDGTGTLNVAADKGATVDVSKADKNGYVVTVKKLKTEDGK